MRKGLCPLNPAPPGPLAGALASHEQLQGMKPPASRKTKDRQAKLRHQNSPLTASSESGQTSLAAPCAARTVSSTKQLTNNTRHHHSEGRQEKTGTLTDRDKEEHRGCDQQQAGEAEFASSGGETVRKGRCPLNPAPPGALAGALASHEQLQGMKSVSRNSVRRSCGIKTRH